MWHIPTASSWKKSSDKERENLSPDAAQRTHTQLSSVGMKTKTSVIEIPLRQSVEWSKSSFTVQRKRPIPTIPGELWKNHPASRRPIPTIPPGGTLLETLPVHQPFLNGSPLSRTSSSVSKGQEKHIEATSSRISVIVPSSSVTMHKGPDCNELLSQGPSLDTPLPTGESLVKSGTLPTPKGQWKTGRSKMTARKSTKSVIPRRQEPPLESSTGDNAVTSSRMLGTTTSTSAKMHEGPSRDEQQPLKHFTLIHNKLNCDPILTGESVSKPIVTPKVRRKSKKSAEPNTSPTKTTANKSMKSTSVLTQKVTSDDDDDATTSPIKDKFVLTTPPEFRFKGDPPRWIRALYLEPLLDGWKREIRTRATIHKQRYDIYYYNPEGQRFRSRVEVGKYLLEEGINKYSAAFNFCFKSLILGGEFEPYEILSANRKRVDTLGTVQKTPPKKCKPHKQKHSSLNLPQAPAPGPEKYPELDIDYSEAGMVFDEEIEVVGTGDGQDAIFDPAVLSLRNQPVTMNMPKVKELHKSLLPPKKQPQASTSKAEKQPNKMEIKLFCICDDVEYGDMVLCDNIKCEIGWFHFRCVKVTSAPAGFWYCPICRGPSSEVMNSSIASGK